MIIPVLSIKNNGLARAMFFGLLVVFISSCGKKSNTSILIAGGGASGVAAIVQAARMGVSTVIVEENEWLGGMLTSAGVCDSLLKTGWVRKVLFEPSVGNNIFSEMTSAEQNLTVMRNDDELWHASE